MNFAPKLKFLNSIWQKILIMFSASETGRGCKWQLLDHRAVNTWRQWGQSTLIVFVFLLCLFVCLFVAFVCLFEKKTVGSANFDYSKKVSRFLNYSLAQWAPLITFWKSFISFSFCCTLIIYQVHCCQRANYTGGRYSLIVQTTGIWSASSNFKSKSWNA